MWTSRESSIPQSQPCFLPQLLLLALLHLSTPWALLPFPLCSNPGEEVEEGVCVCSCTWCVVVCMVSMYMYGGVVCVHACGVRVCYVYVWCVYDVYGLWGCVRVHVCMHACVYGECVMCMVCDVCA